MKFCSKCGKELVDEAVVCVGCGCPVDSKQQTSQQYPQSNQQFTQYVNYPVKKEKKYGGLATAAKVFAIISTVISGFSLLPLAWCLPITISFCNKVNNGEKVGLGLKICMLIFVSRLAGIFALVMGKPKEKEDC